MDRLEANTEAESIAAQEQEPALLAVTSKAFVSWNLSGFSPFGQETPTQKPTKSRVLCWNHGFGALLLH